MNSVMYIIKKVYATHLESDDSVFFYSLDTDDDALDEFFTNSDGSVNDEADYDDYELGDYIDGEEFEDLDEASKRFNDIKADTDLL